MQNLRENTCRRAFLFVLSGSILWKTEAVVQMCTVRKVYLKNSQNSQECNCGRVSFLIKFAGMRPKTLLKKRLSTGVFLWILQHFQEHLFLTEHFQWLLLKKEIQQRCFSVNLAKTLTNLFYKTDPGDCFCGLQNHINRRAQTF